MGHAERIEDTQEACGRLLNQMGLYLRGRADFAGAKSLFCRALTLAEATYGPDYRDVSASLNNLGDALYDAGDLGAGDGAFSAGAVH